MAHRNYDELQALGKHLKVVAGSFAPNGSSAVSAASLLGKGFSVARADVGSFNITLEDTFYDLHSARVGLQLNSGDDKIVKFLGALASPSNKILNLLIHDKSSADLKETTTVQAVADLGVKEISKITFPAAAGATQADYAVFSVGAATAAVWIDINAAGTVPTGAAYVAAATKVKVAAATGDSAYDLAVKAVAAIGALAGVTIVNNNDGSISITQSLMGNVAAPARHNADDSGNGSFVVATTAGGVASNLNSSYFTIFSANDATGYYVWFNVNGEGVDPAVVGKTAVPIALSPSASANTVAAAVNTALDALAAFVSTVVTDTATVVNADFGATTDAADGAAATGFTIAVTQQGDSKAKDISANANNRIHFVLLLKNSQV